MNLYVNDLILYANNTTKKIYYEPITAISKYGPTTVCSTEFHSFREDTLQVINPRLNFLENWMERSRKDIEIIGVWRFNIQNKNYDVIYYQNKKEN